MGHGPLHQRCPVTAFAIPTRFASGFLCHDGAAGADVPVLPGGQVPQLLRVWGSDEKALPVEGVPPGGPKPSRPRASVLR